MTHPKNHGLCYSIGEVLVLHGDYSPDQLWFDFVNAVFPTSVKTPIIKKKKPKQPLTWRLPEEDVPQLILPFATARKVTKGHRKQLSRAKWPTFQRTSSGGLLVLTVKRHWKKERLPLVKVLEWCDANLRGMYVPNQDFIFELEDDYLLALLGCDYFRKPEEKGRPSRRI